MQMLTPRSKEGDLPTGTGRTPPQNPIQRILYHDPGRYIVVSKPADIRMDGEFAQTVEKLIHTAIGVDKNSGLRFVQRLDYATSGVLLAALTRPTAHLAGDQFERRTVDKRYRALLHGTPAMNAEWKWRIAEEHPQSFRMTALSESDTAGRTAHTEMRVLKRGIYHHAPVALVELKPSSGRRHQLRVHAAYSGFPIVGDATYGDEERDVFGDGFQPPRMMLHAVQLKIKLPPAGAPFFGKKSAMKTAADMVFSTECPFEHIRDVVWNISPSLHC